jgi:hypothetical protein
MVDLGLRADQALVYLNSVLQVSQANQAKIAAASNSTSLRYTRIRAKRISRKRPGWRPELQVPMFGSKGRKRVRKVLPIGLPESFGLCSFGRTAFQPASRGLRGAGGNGRTGSRRGHACGNSIR